MNERIAKSCVCCGSRNLSPSPAVLMPFIAHRAFDWRPAEIDESWGLRTIKTGMAYPVCNSLLCRDCHHLFLDIRFSDDELANLYRGYRGPEYVALRDFYEPGYKAKNSQLQDGYKYLPEVEGFLRSLLPESPAVLDWGGDSGKNSPFRTHRRLLHIYDISDCPVVAGARRVDKDQIQREKYDLIVCSNVLEHIPFPANVLHEIIPHMRKGTVLYVELPYENFVRTAPSRASMHLKKKHWHEHINFFNEESLRKLVERSGLRVLKIDQLAITGETCDYVFQAALALP